MEKKKKEKTWVISGAFVISRASR